MARPLRIEYQCLVSCDEPWTAGGNVFSDKKDYELFLAVLQENPELFGFRVTAYRLMANHYHLLVQTPFGNLSRAMRHINGVYTQRNNRKGVPLKGPIKLD